MNLIIITGMPGSGKSELARIMSEEYHIPVVVMGDVIRETIRSRGEMVTPERTREVMMELRRKDGPGAVAKRCLAAMQDKKMDTVVIEGCRSLAEVDVFREHAGRLTIICVHSSPATRFARLQSRGREDAPVDYKSFRDRDMAELAVGIGGVIALSDIMIVNEGSLDGLRQRAHEVVRSVLKGEG